MHQKKRCKHFKLKSELDVKQSASGFTLVEVMIAMVVFSMLMVLVSGAINFSTRYWQQENANLSDKMAEFIYTEKLSRAIAAAQPYGLYYGNNKRLELFFQGTNKELMFVSDTGLYQHGPVVIAIKVIDDREFGTQVQIAEEPMSRTMLINEAGLQSINWQWKVFKSNITLARFVYYGYANLNELKLQRANSNRDQTVIDWYDDYSGRKRNILPQKIALEWQEIKQGVSVNFVMEFPILIDDQRRYNFIEHSQNVKPQ